MKRTVFIVPKYYKLIVLLIAFVGCSVNVDAQSRKNDAAAWLGLSVNAKIYKKFSGRIFTRIRETENFSHLQSYYVDFGGYYSLRPDLSISLNYVYSPSNKIDTDFRLLHQYYVSLNGRHYFGKYWFLSNRIIVQQTSNRFVFDNDNEPYSKIAIREKLGINWKVTAKARLFIADEIKIPLPALMNYTEISRNRLYAGVFYDLTKRLRVDTYFVLQSSFNKKNGDTNDYIYCLTLNYKLKKIFND